MSAHEGLQHDRPLFCELLVYQIPVQSPCLDSPLLVAGGVGALSLSDYVPQLLNEFHPQVSHDSLCG